MRKIAEQSLEEEDEYDPLVPVLRPPQAVRPVLPETELSSGLFYDVGPMNPTVSIHQILVKILSINCRTNDGVPQVLTEGLNNAKYAEDGEGELVVQLESGIVYQTFLVFDKMLQITEHRQHSPLWRVVLNVLNMLNITLRLGISWTQWGVFRSFR